MLNHRMLRYLDEIVTSGSIRQASLRLNIAASAINRQLLALEAELGRAVFPTAGMYMERLWRRVLLCMPPSVSDDGG